MNEAFLFLNLSITGNLTVIFYDMPSKLYEEFFFFQPNSM